MQDMTPREMSRPCEFSYTVSSGQLCPSGCGGHFEISLHLGMPVLICSACGLQADAVEAIANTALAQFYDKHMDLEAALRIVNDFRSHCKSERTSTSIHRALNDCGGFAPGRRAFEQVFVPGK